MSSDAAEVEHVQLASECGEHREVGLPREPQDDGAAENGHSVGTLVDQAADLAESIKPRLRGWLHAAMVPASLIAGVVLICLAHTPQAAWACTVYSVTAWLLFPTSAIYHRGTWGPLGEALLRRLDHANIFLIIAGTCTPLAGLLLPPGQRSVLLWIVWAGALAGIAFRVLWVAAPRWLYTPCYLALGWAPVRYLPDFLHTGGVAVLTLIVAGGLLYSAGAVVYALQRPDPLTPLVRLPRGLPCPDRGSLHRALHRHLPGRLVTATSPSGCPPARPTSVLIRGETGLRATGVHGNLTGIAALF